MRLHCPKCANEIATKNVNIQNCVAKCEQCDSLFAFNTATVSFSSSIVEDTATRKVVKRPEGVNVYQNEEGLDITWREQSQWAWLVIAGGGVMAGLCLTLPFLGIPMTAGIMIVYMLPLFLVAAGIVYWGVASLANTNHLIVADKQIQIKHVPLRLFPTKTTTYSRISQFYSGVFYHRRYHTIAYYGVNIVTNRGEHKRFLEYLPSAEIALFIEQELETFLGIQDRPVLGELPRDDDRPF